MIKDTDAELEKFQEKRPLIGKVGRVIYENLVKQFDKEDHSCDIILNSLLTSLLLLMRGNCPEENYKDFAEQVHRILLENIDNLTHS